MLSYLLMADSLVGLGSHDKALQTLSNFLKDTNSKLLNETEMNKFNNKIKEITKSKSEVEGNLQKFELFKNLENQEKLKLYETLTLRGIKLKNQFHNIPKNFEGKIFIDDNNDLHFPFLIIYEEFNITDYIQVSICISFIATLFLIF